MSMCNEYIVDCIDGKWVWVRLAMGGGGQIVGDFNPDEPEVVQFTPSENAVRVGVHPDRMGPVIRLGEDGRFEYLEMRWGFPPPPNVSNPRPVTNVRNLNSAYWKKWLGVENRCLVPVNRFCEWTETPPKRRKWFKLKDDTPFMFAGIWREWEGTRGTKANPVTGKHLLYAFITTEPNEIVGAIHPKAQPVILTRKQWMTWLQAPWDIAKELVVPSPVAEMAEPTDAPI
jgi:putative SOS response-associated peptidase YedK